MKKLILMRGAPGSGKSFKAKLLGFVVSADDFFMKEGKYLFNTTKLGSAHASCRYKVEEAMKQTVEVIVVDNTNTRLSEMLPYAKLALAYGYEVEICFPETSWQWDAQICFEKNQHGVPLARIQEMCKRLEESKSLTAAELLQKAHLN